MATRAELQVLFHGAVILMIGLLFGLPYGMAISESWNEATLRAVQLGHVGLTVGGFGMFAVGAMMRRLELGERMRSTLAWSLIAANYLFVIAIVISAVWGGRGLEAQGPPSNLLVFVCYLLFGTLTFVAGGLLIAGTWAALRQPRP